MTQNEFNFLQEACVNKLNDLMQELVNNDSLAKKSKEKKTVEKKPKETKKENN